MQKIILFVKYTAITYTTTTTHTFVEVWPMTQCDSAAKSASEISP